MILSTIYIYKRIFYDLEYISLLFIHNLIYFKISTMSKKAALKEKVSRKEKKR